MSFIVDVIGSQERLVCGDRPLVQGTGVDHLAYYFS